MCTSGTIYLLLAFLYVDMFKKILVAFDGSLYARRALDLACSLAKVHNSKLTVLYVIPYGPPLQKLSSGLPKPDREYLEFLRKQAEMIIEGAKEIVEKSGVDADFEILEGHPVERICWYAAEGKFDLVILGKRGADAVKKLGMGSVSERVVRACDRNVLIVR